MGLNLKPFIMKLNIFFPLIFCFIFFPFLKLVAQQSDNQGILKLEQLKSHFEKKIKILNDSLSSINNQITEIKKLEEYKKLAQLDTLRFIEVETNIEARYVDKPNYNENAKGIIPQGTKLHLYDYKFGYWYFKTDSIIGYYHSRYLIETDEMKKFREMFEARDLAIRKIKEAENRKSDSLKQIQSEKLRIQQNEQYKKSLISRYGLSNTEKILQHKIWIGMTREMLISSWGNPNDINRTVGSFGVHEQFVYGSTYVYVENGKLTSWQD